MDFGFALRALKEGCRVTRLGWNGRGMWLELQRPDAHSKMTLPYVYMSTAQGDLVPWLASQTDVLAEDWEELMGRQFEEALPYSPTVARQRLDALSKAARAYELAQHAAAEHGEPIRSLPRDAFKALNDAEAQLHQVAVGEGWMPSCAACGDDVPAPERVAGQGDAEYCASCADFLIDGVRS